MFFEILIFDFQKLKLMIQNDVLVKITISNFFKKIFKGELYGIFFWEPFRGRLVSVFELIKNIFL